MTLPPTLLIDRVQLARYGVGAGALCLFGLAVFLIWPTAVPGGLVAEERLASAGFSLLKGIDAAGNACPSLHVATAVFSAIWLDRILVAMRGDSLVRAVNVAWAFGISYSTLATKQHVFLDALAGGALGAIAAALSLAWISRQPPGIR